MGFWKRQVSRMGYRHLTGSKSTLSATEDYQAGGIEQLKKFGYQGMSSEFDKHGIPLESYFKEHPPRTVAEAQYVIQEQTGIELLFLPSYSPHLNLIERLWRFARKECLYSRYYPKFDGFKQALADCIQNAHLKHRDKLETLLTWNFQSFEKVKISTV